MSRATKPVVGVIGSAHVVNDRRNVQLVEQRNLRAVDGILLTSARANVHPTRFGVEPDPWLENGEIHPDPQVVFADRHEVRLVADGAFAGILGSEAIRIVDVPSFAFGAALRDRKRAP